MITIRVSIIIMSNKGRGSRCSINGKNYEVKVFNIVKKCKLNKNKNGFCKLSVTIACKPKNINKLINSEFTLDNQVRLPNNLVYDDNL